MLKEYLMKLEELKAIGEKIMANEDKYKNEFWYDEIECMDIHIDCSIKNLTEEPIENVDDEDYIEEDNDEVIYLKVSDKMDMFDDEEYDSATEIISNYIVHNEQGKEFRALCEKLDVEEEELVIWYEY